MKRRGVANSSDPVNMMALPGSVVVAHQRQDLRSEYRMEALMRAHRESDQVRRPRRFDPAARERAIVS